MVPEQLHYTADHEWVAPGDGGRARVGITHYAQDALGDIVFLQLPEAGAEVRQGEPIGEVESTKSVSEIYAPVSGTVVAVNQAAAENPAVVNHDPYGEGWLFEVDPDGDAGEALAALLPAAEYRKLIETES